MELNLENLVYALSWACSSDVQEVKRGEQALDSLSSKGGYYSALISVISSQGQQVSCSEEVRWMASIALKNGVDKFWRRQVLEEDETWVEQEKTQIKMTILAESAMFEKNPKIKILLAVSISKIARLDCPEKWPELLPCLMQGVEQCVHDPHNNNALLYLYHVTKVLSMKRLPASRHTFRSLAAEAFPIFQQLFQVNYDKFLTFYSTVTNQGDNTRLEERVVEDLLLTIKTIRKLVIHGFTKVREIQEVTNFLEVSVTNHMPVLTKCSLTQPMAQPLPICLCKLYYELIYNDPLCYAPFVGSSMKFLLQTFFIETTNIPSISEKFKLRALNLLKLILLCEEFQPKETLIHLEHPLTLQAREAINGCLTSDILVSCIRVCVEFYLLIQPSQMEEWNEDPENFFNQTTTGGESWQTNILASIESLFVTLIKQNIDITANAIFEIYSSVIGGQNQDVVPQDTRTILAFDAVLHAMGLALYDLNAKTNLDNGLFEVLEKFVYANSSNEDMKILRRRVFWFFTYWIDVGLPEEMLERLLKMIVFAFNSEKDPVVSLTVVKTIHVLVDNLDIPQELIVQHTAVIVGCLHSMIQSLEQDDSKSKVLSTFSLVIDKTRFDLLPFLDRILSLLENLWTDSSDDSQQFLRSAVVECLSFVVIGLKEKCDACYVLVKPILCHCLDHENEQSLNLMTDGLDLLLNFIQNTATEENTDLLTFVPNVLPCFELGAEYVQISLHVISSYAVLFRTNLAISFGVQINSAFRSLFKDTSRDLMTLLVQTIRTYFRLCVTSEKEATVNNSLFELLSPLLQEVLDQDCSSLVEADLIGIFSRLILEQSHIFVTILTLHSSETNVTPEDVLCRLIGIVCDCIDDIVCVRTRKLTALALIYALNPSNISVELIKKRFVDVVYVCLSCLHDLADVMTGAEDMLLVRSPQVVVEGLGPLSESVETAHDRREQLLDSSCLTSTVNLKEELGNLFTILRNNSAIPFDELFNSIDVSCRSQLEQFYFPK